MKDNTVIVNRVSLDSLGDIKAKRKEKKISQVKIAKYCGVSLQAYQLWEGGLTKKVSKDNFDKLSYALENGI